MRVVPPPRRGPAPRVSAVRLLDADPALGAGVDPGAWEAARRELVLPAIELAVGPWRPASGGDGPGLALLLVRGLVCREVELAGHAGAELLGPGDVLDGGAVTHGSLDVEVRWTVHQPVTAVVLGAHLQALTQRWPELARSLQQRLCVQHARTAVLATIAQLPRVELRVHALLWHLAERFGRVTSDGVHLPMPLTHRLIGSLVGARRPTVTLAVGELERSGAVHRDGLGGWLLRRGAGPLHRPAEPAEPAATADVVVVA